MFALRAASGLVEVKFWCCGARTGTGLPFDSAVSADGLTLQCRQLVFRCLGTDIAQPGWHKWQTNYAASPNDAGFAVDRQGALCAETQVP